MKQVEMHGQFYTFARIGSYPNGRPCYGLVDANGESVYRVSVNLPDVELAPDELLVKDYSENTGMLAALREAAVVYSLNRSVPSGYVQLPVVRLVGTPPTV